MSDVNVTPPSPSGDPGSQADIPAEPAPAEPAEETPEPETPAEEPAAE